MAFQITVQIKTHSFAERVIFKDTSFSLKSGDFVYLAGKSGTGKSTVLRLMAGLDHINNGELITQPDFQGNILYLRQMILLLSQTPYFWPDTVEANLKIPFAFHSRLPGDYNRDLAIELLAKLGLNDSYLNKQTAQLSGGEKQKIALIRGVLLEPTCLLMDEPIASCDPESALAIQNVVKDWLRAKAERCCLYSSHTPFHVPTSHTLEIINQQFVIKD